MFLCLVYQLIRAYRVLGHFLAKLDPLNLEQSSFTKVKEVCNCIFFDLFKLLILIIIGI